MLAVIIVLFLLGSIDILHPRFGSPRLNPRIPHSKVWTAGKLRRIASDSTISEALDAMVETANGRRWIPLDSSWSHRKYAVDSATPHDIRQALLRQAGWKTSVRQDLLSFVKSGDAALTCSTPRSAGATGLYGCTARCQRRPLEFLGGRKPIAEGCYILCSLAVAPCHARPFTWAAWFKAGEQGMDELVLGSFHRLLDVAVTISTLARFFKGMTTKEAIVYLGALLLVEILILVVSLVVMDYQEWSYQNRLRAVPENLEQRRAVPENLEQRRAVPENLEQRRAVPEDLEQRRAVPEDLEQRRAVPEDLEQRRAVPEDLEQFRAVLDNLVQHQANLEDLQRRRAVLEDLVRRRRVARALWYVRRHVMGGLNRFDQANENVSEDESDDETEVESFKWEDVAECESGDDDNSLHSQQQRTRSE